MQIASRLAITTMGRRGPFVAANRERLSQAVFVLRVKALPRREADSHCANSSCASREKLFPNPDLEEFLG
jgi:hypothetical protein